MLKSPFKFLGFNGHAKTPKQNPQNERKMSGKLRKVRRPANTSVNIADRPSIPMEKELDADISTVVTEGKHSGEYYQNQVRTSASPACNQIRTMYSPRVYRPSAHPMPSIHFHRTRKPMKITIYLLRYLQIPVETLQVARNLKPSRPSLVTLTD